MKAGPHREVFGVDRDDFAFQYPPLLDFWTSWRIVDLSREGSLISKPVRVVGRKLILILAHLRQAGKLVEARAMFQEVTRESEIPLDFFGSLSEQILAQGEVATHVGFQRPFGWNDLDGPIGAGGSPFFFLDRIGHVDVPVFPPWHGDSPVWGPAYTQTKRKDCESAPTTFPGSCGSLAEHGAAPRI